MAFIEYLKNNWFMSVLFIVALVLFVQGIFFTVTKKAVIMLGIIKPKWLDRKQSLILGIFYIFVSVSLFIYVLIGWSNYG